MVLAATLLCIYSTAALYLYAVFIQKYLGYGTVAFVTYTGTVAAATAVAVVLIVNS